MRTYEELRERHGLEGWTVAFAGTPEAARSVAASCRAEGLSTAVHPLFPEDCSEDRVAADGGTASLWETRVVFTAGEAEAG